MIRNASWATGMTIDEGSEPPRARHRRRSPRDSACTCRDASRDHRARAESAFRSRRIISRVVIILISLDAPRTLPPSRPPFPGGRLSAGISSRFHAIRRIAQDSPESRSQATRSGLHFTCRRSSSPHEAVLRVLVRRCSPLDSEGKHARAR